MGFLNDHGDRPLPAPRREHSIGSVAPISRSPRYRPEPATLFDQDSGTNRRVVVLSTTDARAVRNLLAQARRGRLMGPPVDDAIDLLDRLTGVEP